MFLLCTKISVSLSVLYFTWYVYTQTKFLSHALHTYFPPQVLFKTKQTIVQWRQVTCCITSQLWLLTSCHNSVSGKRPRSNYAPSLGALASVTVRTHKRHWSPYPRLDYTYSVDNILTTNYSACWHGNVDNQRHAVLGVGWRYATYLASECGTKPAKTAAAAAAAARPRRQTAVRPVARPARNPAARVIVTATAATRLRYCLVSVPSVFRHVGPYTPVFRNSTIAEKPRDAPYDRLITFSRSHRISAECN